MAATFSPADVERLAVLARVDLTTDEIATFAAQLNGILAFAAAVQGVPTDDLSLSPSSTRALPLREDDIQPSLGQDAVLSAAPAADGATGLFTVPRVFAE